jgi:hypothetical protein
MVNHHAVFTIGPTLRSDSGEVPLVHSTESKESVMPRVNLDKEPPDVQRFIESLAVQGEGIDLEINGRVVCRLIPSAHLTDSEKERLVRDRWALMHRAQERNRNVPAEILEREVLDAVDEVRRQNA